MKSTVILFDLDGTITRVETLPIIAQHFGINEEITHLTKETVAGNIPFIESFIQRVNILKELPVSEIDYLLSQVPLFEMTASFIQENLCQCAVVTGNFEGWVQSLLHSVGCEFYASKGAVSNDRILKLTHIVKKEDIVRKYKDENRKVIFIGDGNNDAEAMRLADIGVAFGGVHSPSNTVMHVATHAIYSEEELCRFLKQLL